jgi:hypothetical protein
VGRGVRRDAARPRGRGRRDDQLPARGPRLRRAPGGGRQPRAARPDRRPALGATTPRPSVGTPTASPCSASRRAG